MRTSVTTQEPLFDAGPPTATNLRIEVLFHVDGPCGTTLASVHVSDHLSGSVFVIEALPVVRFPLDQRELVAALHRVIELSEIHSRPF